MLLSILLFFSTLVFPVPLFFSTFFFPFPSIVPAIIFPFLFIMTTVFSVFAPALMVGAEVFPAEMFPVTAVAAILPISIGTDLFYPAVANTVGKAAIWDFNPRAVVMMGTVPAVAVVQIVIIRAEYDVIGGVYADIKTECGGGDKKRRHFETD